MNRQEQHMLQSVRGTNSNRTLKEKFEKRILEGSLSRSENELNHFCIMFMAYDPNEKKYFIGNHRKSGLWLFSGGHSENEESPSETLIREVEEEWGQNIVTDNNLKPYLLTISEINNKPKQLCELHYDIWYVFKRPIESFDFDEDKLLSEFSEYGWKTADEIGSLETHKTTLKVVEEIEHMEKNR